MTKNKESLRECVLNTEAQLRSIVGDCVEKWFTTPRSDYECEQ